MFKNYLKIAFRNLAKNPSYSFINIFGLALGITAFVLILMFIRYELSYDDYHEDADRIYRVSREWKNQDGETSLHLGQIAPPFKYRFEEEFGEKVDEVVRVFNVSPTIKVDDNSFVEERFYFSDPNIFNVFSWEIIAGNPEAGLTNPDGLVINESTAMKYFGRVDVIGEAMDFSLFGSEAVLQVSAVVQDIPENSHFQFDLIGSMFPVIDFLGGPDEFDQAYGRNMFATYMLLAENTDPDDIQAGMPAIIDKVFPQEQFNMDFPASEVMKLHMMPVTDIHLHSNLDSELEPNGNIEYIYIFTAVALFILFIACINFMNLSTARSAKRANEVGVRKVMGAYRSSLIRQFIGESFLIALIALIISILFVELLLPYFNDFIDKSLVFEFLSLDWLFTLVGIILVIGIIAGSYPALVLSSFQPATVLKGSFKAKNSHQVFRSTLVVVQFTISIGLIVSMGVVYNQLNFIQNKDLGLDKENVAIVSSSPAIAMNYVDIKERLIAQPGILDVSMQSRVPSGRLLDSQGGSYELNDELIDLDFRVADVHVSHNYLELFGVEMVSGRNFDIELASDSSQAFILNESAITRMGFANPDQAIGSVFNYGGRQGFIIGVVEDFHFESLHQSIAPIVFMISQDRNYNVAVRFAPTNKDEALAFVEEQWSIFMPDTPFDYNLISDFYDQLYTAEQQLAKIFSYFALLAIIIAILGLFGLSSFTIQQRIKEIGIRKVLGASVSQLVTLMSTSFAKLILFAFLLATPIVWYGMDKWLDSFAYQAGINPLIFVAGGVIAMVIALLTISFQAIKAALANPVHSLKSE